MGGRKEIPVLVLACRSESHGELDPKSSQTTNKFTQQSTANDDDVIASIQHFHKTKNRQDRNEN
jgi:hypothetical protein